MTAVLDVVVVAYGSRDVIGDCVDAARGLPGVREVVVVDHGSDDAGAVAASRGATVLRDETNPGFGAGQNRGVGVGSAPYVLLLNPDAMPKSCGVSDAVALLDRDKRVGAAQGVIMNRASGQPERSQGRELRSWHLIGRSIGARWLLDVRVIGMAVAHITPIADHVRRVPGAEQRVESLAATALVVRREAFEQIGGFDETYFLYGEDLDLCRRLRDSRWDLVSLPIVGAWHESGGSSESVVEREMYWWNGTMQFAARHWGPGEWVLAVTAAAVQWARLVSEEPRLWRRTGRALLAEPFRERRRRDRTERRSGDVEHALECDA